MNKNSKETFEKYLDYVEDYMRITIDLQESIIEGYELGELTMDEVVDFYRKMYNVIYTDRMKEVGENFNEIFGEALTEMVMELTDTEEG
jgi:hypothetical protein